LKKIDWQTPLALMDVAQTRQLESLAAARIGDGPNLMAQAGLAIAKLALATHPFGRCFWIFCGPGNNGGDGLEAAAHLHQWGQTVRVVLWQPDKKRPIDASQALQKVKALGMAIQDTLPDALSAQDVCIDAMLGIGLRAPEANNNASVAALQIASWIDAIYHYGADVLAVDVPSGLNANTGQFQTSAVSVQRHATHTLQLLTAKPGCFTALGRDACGMLWLDTLGCDDLLASMPASAQLNVKLHGPSKALHASHKGTYGDVTVIGGESIDLRGMGMTGAVDLAASAALHAGAGRVMACFLSADAKPVHPAPRLPEMMLRDFAALQLRNGAIVCGLSLIHI
jgi:hydroxyethylthiazole kinase-like uncharacterized protein yjeF